jgi:hypothetical protein
MNLLSHPDQQGHKWSKEPMPTTLRLVETNAKPIVKREREPLGALLAIGCTVVLLLAAVASVTLPIALGTDNADMTWLIGP